MKAGGDPAERIRRCRDEEAVMRAGVADQANPVGRRDPCVADLHAVRLETGTCDTQALDSIGAAIWTKKNRRWPTRLKAATRLRSARSVRA